MNVRSVLTSPPGGRHSARCGSADSRSRHQRRRREHGNIGADDERGPAPLEQREQRERERHHGGVDQPREHATRADGHGSLLRLTATIAGQRRAGNQWQHNPGRCLPAMVHGCVRRRRRARRCAWLAGVGIAIEPRKIAARDLQPDSMSSAKDHAGRPQRDRDLGRFSGGWRGFRAVGAPDDPVGHVERDTVGVDVHQFRGEVDGRR